MPIYEFRCKNCEKTFDEFRHSTQDTQHALCPVCGAGAGRKYSLAATFVEGAGFREDNYLAFGGKRISSKAQLKSEMRRLEAESTWEYTDPESGEVLKNEVPMQLEANAL